MITKDEIEKAIEKCIRKACGRTNDEWYAVTLLPDGTIEQRCGMGVVTYGENEYFNRPGAERTIYVIGGIPDLDPCSEWVDPDTGEVDEEGAIQEIVSNQMESIDWTEILVGPTTMTN